MFFARRYSGGEIHVENSLVGILCQNYSKAGPSKLIKNKNDFWTTISLLKISSLRSAGLTAMTAGEDSKFQLESRKLQRELQTL